MSKRSSRALGIVVPTYNRWPALLRCLKHLEDQTYKDFEVVVVDDGSTDCTETEMQSYAATSPMDLQYLRQDNGGPAKARNLAISKLNAPICLMIGDDIFASSTLAERHIAFHRAHPDLNAAALGLTRWTSRGQTITPFMAWLEKQRFQFAYEELLAGAEPNIHHFYTSNVSLKTDLLRKFPFDERFPFAAMEDTELACRIQRQHGLKLQFLPEALAYHLHPTTFKQGCERMLRVGYSYRLFDDLWPDQQISLPAWKRGFYSALLAVGRRPALLRLLVDLVELCNRTIGPSRLINIAFRCKFLVGYESERDTNGNFVNRSDRTRVQATRRVS